jgi:hypothetical protein
MVRMGRALAPLREKNSYSRPLLKVKSYSQRAADKKKGGGKSASAQPIFRIPARSNNQNGKFDW